MDIWLVRHGEASATWGKSADPELSELGREQALAVARELGPRLHGDTRLLSSPLRRARETAEPLCARLDLPLEISRAVAEIPAPVPLAQRQQWLQQFMRERWDEQSPAVIAWRDRALECLHELRTPAVIFTHFLVINAVVGNLQGSPKTLYFWPDNGSLTRLQVSASGLRLVTLGRELTTLVN